MLVSLVCVIHLTSNEGLTVRLLPYNCCDVDSGFGMSATHPSSFPENTLDRCQLRFIPVRMENSDTTDLSVCV